MLDAFSIYENSAFFFGKREFKKFLQRISYVEKIFYINNYTLWDGEMICKQYSKALYIKIH